MRVGERRARKPAARNGAADRIRGRAVARRPVRARRDERHAKNGRVAVVVSLFLELLATALLVGGPAVIQPLLQSAMAARDTKQVGQIIYSMPDRTLCRHLSFDNETAELTEGAVAQCPQDLAKGRGRAEGNFAWGAR